MELGLGADVIPAIAGVDHGLAADLTDAEFGFGQELDNDGGLVFGAVFHGAIFCL